MRVAPLLLVGLMFTVPPASALLGALPSVAQGGEVIVGFREGTLAETRARVIALGATVTQVNEHIDFLVARTNDLPRFMIAIAGVASVEYVEKNDRMRIDGAQWNGAQWNEANATGAQWNGAQWNGAQWNTGPDFSEPDPGRGWQWGLERVRAPDAWNTTTGTRSASLCVLDTGVDLQHPDLEANLWTGALGEHGYNTIDVLAPPDDDAGHGTHIAGIAAAAVGNGFGTAGIGNVEIIAVKVLSADGTGFEADLATGLTWCAAAGADVAVMALSVDDDGPTLRAAIGFAKARDVLLLASAGNDGCDSCVGFPARHPDVVAVGAIGPDGNVASFSSRGGSLDLAAPGVDILSTFAGGEYRYGTGTSQAVAFAAGAATLLRDAEPGLSAGATRDRLYASAQDVGNAGWDSGSGNGLLNVAAAIR